MRYTITNLYAVKLPGQLDHGSRNLEHRAGAALLKYGLREMFGIELHAELVERGPAGKPSLANYPKIHYNISHSGDYAVCAIGPEPLGIDLERRRVVDYERLAKKAFSAKEQDELAGCSDPQAFFFDRWVEKESYLKWKGTGITRDMGKIDLTDGWCCHVWLEDGYSSAVWAKKPLKLKLCRIDFYDLFEDDRMQ